MKFTLVLAAAASLVAAQDFAGQPTCAIPCLRDNIPKVGCSLTDTACQCDANKQKELAPLAAVCLLTACSGDDLIKAQAAAASACAAFSATAGAGSPSTTAAPPVVTTTSSAPVATVTIPTNGTLTLSTTARPTTGGPTTTGSTPVSTAGAARLAAGGVLGLALGAVALF